MGWWVSSKGVETRWMALFCDDGWLLIQRERGEETNGGCLAGAWRMGFANGEGKCMCWLCGGVLRGG